MKKIFYLFSLLFFFHVSYAQINAITDTGEEVLLLPDGTWKYVNDSVATEMEIPTNPNEFNKHNKSTFLVKSKKMNIGVYINAKKWTFKKGKVDEPSEFLFQRKGEDLYAMLIVEKFEIPVETLANIALDNAREVSPDVRVVKKEYRNVNGLKVLLMQMKGSMQGIGFTYYGYYYSNTTGSVQFVSYSAESMFDTYNKKMEDLINGFVEL